MTTCRGRAAAACAAAALACAALSCGTRPPTDEPYPTADEVAANWPCFRGPGSAGVAPATGARGAWDASSGLRIAWKTAVPLKGASSPVVWGSRVYLTGADANTREVYCFDAADGSLVWRRAVDGVPGGGLPIEETWTREEWGATTYAASTPATDGRRVYAVFANGDLACFDAAGAKVWAKGLGPVRNSYGHASSLCLDRGSLFVQLDVPRPERGPAASHLVALRASTGDVRWDVPRDVRDSWATPVVTEVAGRRQLVTAAEPWIVSYDPATGAELWKVKGLSGDVVPSPVVAGGLVFVAMETSKLFAIRPDGAGDVTGSHVAWTATDDLPSMPTPVSDGTRLFVVSSSGILTAWDVATGKKLFDADLERSFLASPVLAGDRIWAFSDEGEAVIVRSASTFEEPGRWELGEPVSATPAVVGARMFVRGERHLFCIAGGG